MNETYTRNIEFIKSNNINLYNRINNHLKAIEVQILSSKDNNKYMQVKQDGRVYNINSKYRPLDEAFKWVEGLEIRNNSKIILLGLGIGYRVRHITQKMTNKNQLLIIEPSIEIFIEVIKNFDLINLLSNKNVKLLISEEENIVKKAIRDFAIWKNVKQLVVGIIPNYNNIFTDLYNQYTRLIKEEIDCQLINYQTGQHLVKAWYKNFLSNIPSILNSYKVNELKDRFKNKPVIIVSAGPSLNKNVKLLKKVKDKALIICVGTALKVLKKEGITPHIIVTLDGAIENYYHFENIDFSNILLLYLPIVYPQILLEHKGNKVICINYLPYLGKELFDVLGDIRMLEVGGSVAHAAFSLARELNANPIVFIGQDLAYGEENQTHAKGTSFDEGKVEHKANKVEENLLIVEDINGREVLTDKVLFSFLKWFERKIEEDISERIYIDATEGGAKINGTQIMTLQETIDKYMKENLTEEISYVIGLNNSKKIHQSCDVKLVIRDLKSISEKMKALDKKFEEGLNIIDKLKDSYRNNITLENESEFIKEINKINKDFIEDTESSKVLSYVLYFATYKIDENDFGEFDYSINNKKYMAISNQEYLFDTAQAVIKDLLEVIKESTDELQNLDLN